MGSFFLGGPLHFLPQLRERFIETLGLEPHQRSVPDDSEVFVAKGAALASVEQPVVTMQSLIDRIHADVEIHVDTEQTLEPLFMQI